MTDLNCPDCGSPMRLRDSRFGKFYGCVRFPACKATHGAHADGRPLGIPGNAETKAARTRAHAAFDRLWRSGRMRRNDAYRELQRMMHMTEAQAHIGRFTQEECERLIELLEDRPT
jgi:ssDNA-binding Zn-finger/Zn-ribbon topoisomerase 1